MFSTPLLHSNLGLFVNGKSVNAKKEHLYKTEKNAYMNGHGSFWKAQNILSFTLLDILMNLYLIHFDGEICPVHLTHPYCLGHSAVLEGQL